MHLLGPVVLVQGRATVPSTSALLRTFLAIVAVGRDRRAAADTIIDELWGESLPRDPRPALQALATRLRRWMRDVGADPQELRFEHDAYVLALPPERIDVRRFEMATREVLEGPMDDLVRVLEFTRRATAEWKGEPFAGCAPSFLLEQERLRLNDLALAVAERRCAALIEMGGFDSAIAELRSLLAKNPAREQLAALAMTALYRAGRQREALQLFQGTRRMLGERFGLEPGPDLVRLEERICQQDDTLDLIEGAYRPPARRARPLIVGRETYLARIHNDHASGLAHVLVVTGEAGVGKTTLLLAAAADVAEAGSSVALATFGADASPLATWHDALRQLGVPLPIGGADGLHERLADRVRAGLARRAGAISVHIFLDDVHQADSASLGLLVDLCRAGLPRGVAIVVAARQPDVVPHAAWQAALADLARLPGVRQLALDALDRTAVRRLAEVRLAHLGAASQDRLSTLLFERTAGHPLHMASLLDVMAPLSDESACAAAALQVPGTLLPLIRYQLGALGREGMEVLEALAVAGPTREDVLADVLGGTPAAVLRGLRPAFDLGLVIEEGGRFRLRHGLTAQVVNGATPASVQERLHLALLSRLGGDADPFLVLRHAVGAGSLVDGHRLGVARLAAARTSYSRGAFAEALSLASDASANLTGPDRLTADLYRGFALAALGQTTEADSVLDDVLDQSLGVDAEVVILAAVGHEPLGIRAGGDERRLARLRRAFPSARPSRGSLRLDLVRALITEETLLYGELRTREAGDELEYLTFHLHSVEAEARLAQLHARGMVDANVPAAERVEAAELARKLAERTGDVLLRLDALELLASATLAAAELERCEDLRWELSRLADRAGRPRSRWITRLLEAACLLAAGNQDADEAAQQALALGTSLGIADAAGAYGVFRVGHALQGGDLAELLPITEFAVAAYPRLAAWHAAAALSSVHSDDAGAARAHLERFFALRRELSNRYFDRPGLALAAHAAAELEDRAAGEEVLRSLRPDRAVIVVGAGAAVLGPVNLAVGLAELAAGRPDVAASRLTEAIALAREIGWTPWASACESWLDRTARTGSAARRTTA